MSRSAGTQIPTRPPTGHERSRPDEETGATGALDRVANLMRSWGPVLVPVVIVLVGAWLYRWVDEDGFIDFRIIDHLLAGHGMVFNIGERVEVDSDPLWMLSLALLHEAVPFVTLEWLSVIFGLGCTAGGFLAGGRAAQRLGESRGEGAVFPIGLLICAVVAGVWEFATSGLEMSMVFLWLAVTLGCLVRVESRRRSSCLSAMVVGLGPLIRPELALMSAVFLGTLLVVVAAPGWRGRTSRACRYGAPVVAAVAIPFAYQVFRMMYFGLLVPNTALAKTAGTMWWSQGFAYLWNFVAPYTLWLPLLLAAPFVAVRMATWWRLGDRIGVLLLASPLVAGVADALYVVSIGGDYMHARLLLPAFFAICLPLFATVAQVRTWLAVPLAGIVVWAAVCGGFLRFVPRSGSLDPRVISISNERNSWISATGNAHPITASDYHKALSGKAGTLLRHIAADVPPGHQELIVITDPYAAIEASSARPARSPLPFALAIDLPAIGVIGYLSGPSVYVFDDYSLADPIGSHTMVVVHARPGHEKLIGPSWMVARFGVPGGPMLAGGPSTQSIDAARSALACPPLNSYLRAITGPLTWSKAASNLTRSFQFTTMSFSADPSIAAAQLCDRHG
jgi:arabinofuranosyltransferase